MHCVYIGKYVLRLHVCVCYLFWISMWYACCIQCLHSVILHIVCAFCHSLHQLALRQPHRSRQLWKKPVMLTKCHFRHHYTVKLLLLTYVSFGFCENWEQCGCCVSMSFADSVTIFPLKHQYNCRDSLTITSYTALLTGVVWRYLLNRI